MTCPEPERWSELADASRRAELEQHLDACEACRELVAALARAAPVHDATIGGYVVQGMLGAGGMGLVLAAYDPRLQRVVALKLVRGIEGERARSRLVEEARAMARLAHPNVVAVHEVVAEGNDLFIAMERVDGPNLAGWLAGERRSRRDRLAVVLGVARGIAAAHEVGLVHRDIKPANILIGRDGRPRLTDLGLAAATAGDELAAGSPHASRLVGTPGYIAPEVGAGAAADARSDQFAFAVTAMQALPDAGRRIASVLRRARSEQPGDRFASMTELIDALDRAARPRWPIALSAALVLAALAAGGAWWRGRSHETCVADPTLAGAWTPARRAVLATSLAEHDRSPGHTISTTVLALFEQRASAWTSAVSDVCEGRARGTLSDSLADMRGACLDDQRHELAAVVDDLAREPADRALAHLAKLPLAASCDRASPPPSDNPLHAALKVELARIHLLRDRAKYAEASAAADALAAAVPAGDSWWIAKLAMLRGELERRRGDAAGALPILHDALAAAERTDDRELRLKALIALLQTLDELGRSDETATLVPIVEAAAARPDVELYDRISVEMVLGDVAHTTGAYAKAERHYRAALADLEREYAGMPAPAIAGVLSSLGATQHSLARLDEARTTLQRSLAMFEQTVGPEHPDVALPISELANIAIESRDFDTAQRDYERVLAVRTAALGPEHPYLCEPLDRLGVIAERRGDRDRALELYRRSLAVAEHGFGKEHPLVAVAEYHIASLQNERGRLDEARTFAEASVKIWDTTHTELPESYDAHFLLARLVWPTDHARARALAEQGRAGYAALAPPYDRFAAEMAKWLEQHR